MTLNTIRRYTVKVTDGLLRVQLRSNHPMGQTIRFMTVYPEAQKTAGRKWMDTLDKLSRERYRNKIAVSLPPKARGVPRALWGG